jgi:hypothetical protein
MERPGMWTQIFGENRDDNFDANVALSKSALLQVKLLTPTPDSGITMLRIGRKVYYFWERVDKCLRSLHDAESSTGQAHYDVLGELWRAIVILRIPRIHRHRDDARPGMAWAVLAYNSDATFDRSTLAIVYNLLYMFKRNSNTMIRARSTS